jgi:hypothetical protein
LATSSSPKSDGAVRQEKFAASHNLPHAATRGWSIVAKKSKFRDSQPFHNLLQ